MIISMDDVFVQNIPHCGKWGMVWKGVECFHTFPQKLTIEELRVLYFPNAFIAAQLLSPVHLADSSTYIRFVSRQ